MSKMAGSWDAPLKGKDNVFSDRNASAFSEINKKPNIANIAIRKFLLTIIISFKALAIRSGFLKSNYNY